MSGRLRAPRDLIGIVRRLIFAAALASAAPSFAFADQCNFSDAGQAVNDIASSDFWKQCSDEFDDSTYVAMVLFLSAGAVGEDIQHTGSDPNQAPPNYFTQFCTTALNDINSGTAKTVQDVINQLPDSVKQSATDALNSVLGDTASTDLASVGDAFVCACKSITLNGLAQLGSVIGACAHDAACQLSNNTLECCPQAPTPLTQISCALPPCNSPYVYFPQPDPSQPNQNCTNGPSLASAGQGETEDNCFNNYWLSPHCYGDTCYSADPNRPPDGSPTYVCTCPVAMQIHMHETEDGGYIACGCPPGSFQKGNQCVCSGGATVNWNGGNVAPSCPPAPPPAPVCAPTCGPGQSVAYTDQAACKYTCECPDGQVSADGQCVTPCVGGEVMLGGGACCKASQATTCGVCCPDGMAPDATGATCVSRPLPSKAQFVPNPPKPNATFRPNVGKP